MKIRNYPITLSPTGQSTLGIESTGLTHEWTLLLEKTHGGVVFKIYVDDDFRYYLSKEGGTPCIQNELNEIISGHVFVYYLLRMQHEKQTKQLQEVKKELQQIQEVKTELQQQIQEVEKAKTELRQKLKTLEQKVDLRTPSLDTIQATDTDTRLKEMVKELVTKTDLETCLKGMVTTSVEGTDGKRLTDLDTRLTGMVTTKAKIINSDTILWTDLDTRLNSLLRGELWTDPDTRLTDMVTTKLTSPDGELWKDLVTRLTDMVTTKLTSPDGKLWTDLDTRLTGMVTTKLTSPDGELWTDLDTRLTGMVTTKLTSPDGKLCTDLDTRLTGMVTTKLTFPDGKLCTDLDTRLTGMVTTKLTSPDGKLWTDLDTRLTGMVTIGKYTDLEKRLTGIIETTDLIMNQQKEQYVTKGIFSQFIKTANELIDELIDPDLFVNELKEKFDIFTKSDSDIDIRYELFIESVVALIDNGLDVLNNRLKNYIMKTRKVHLRSYLSSVGMDTSFCDLVQDIVSISIGEKNNPGHEGEIKSYPEHEGKIKSYLEEKKTKVSDLIGYIVSVVFLSQVNYRHIVTSNVSIHYALCGQVQVGDDFKISTEMCDFYIGKKKTIISCNNINYKGNKFYERYDEYIKENIKPEEVLRLVEAMIKIKLIEKGEIFTDKIGKSMISVQKYKVIHPLPRDAEFIFGHGARYALDENIKNNKFINIFENEKLMGLIKELMTKEKLELFENLKIWISILLS
jgi:hypothetical protein